MIVTIDIPASTRRRIARDGRLAAAFPDVLADGLAAACEVGANRIAAMLVTGELPLRSDSLARAVFGELRDRRAPEGVLGIRKDSPAARWAAIQERGGTIYPRTRRALAIPVSDEAKRSAAWPSDGYWSGRLAFIARPGRPPLLVEKKKAYWTIHFVLKRSVTLRPTRFWTIAVGWARPDIAQTLADVVTARFQRAQAG